MIGQAVSRYKIPEKLGEGGVGEVFKAEDATLGRPAALKSLAVNLLNGNEAKQRFRGKLKRPPRSHTRTSATFTRSPSKPERPSRR